MSHFTRELRRLNNYPENWEWQFLPGMKFGDTVKWWGAGGARKRPHEGLDLLILLDERGTRHLLPAGTIIPPALPGTAVARVPDFLGETVILAHENLDGMGRRLHTFYAHLQPSDSPTSGKILGHNSQVGRIAHPKSEQTACPPHLHISIAWVGKSYPIDDGFRWDEFTDSESFRPGDPLLLIS